MPGLKSSWSLHRRQKAIGKERETMAQMKRKRLKKWILAAAILLLLGILLWSIRITDIKVTGSARYIEAEMTNLLFPEGMDRNTLYCLYKERFQPHREIPFVADYDILFRSPSKVEVMVYEKSIVGYVSYLNSYMYFDKDGIIVESTSNKLEGVPRIEGLNFGQIVLGEPLPAPNMDIFREILNLTQVLSLYNMEVDKITYNVKEQATLTMGDVNVFLGTSDDMNGKISELHDMLPQIEGLKGTLYLDTYDELKTDTMFSFIQE